MIDQNKLKLFTDAARAKGYKDDEIASVLRAKTGAEQFNTTPTPAPEAKPQNFLQKAGQFLFPRMKSMYDAGKGAIGLNKTVTKTDEELRKQAEAMRQLALQARNEQDPVKKEALLAESRAISAGIESKSGGLSNEVEAYKTKSGVRDSELADTSSAGKLLGKDLTMGNLKFATRKGVAATGEALAWAMPTAKVAKGAGIVKNIMAGAATGAGAGAISGITDTESTDEWWKKAGKGAISGGIVGGAVGGAFGGLGKIASSLSKKPDNMINRVIHWKSPTEMANFKKTSGLDPTKEIIARDVKNWTQGMDGPALTDYFWGRKDEVMSELTDALSKAPGGLSKQEVLAFLTSQADNLAPGKVNLGSKPALEALSGIMEEVAQLPDNLSWVDVQKLKSQLQELGSAAFSPTGTATPASKALAQASDFFKDAIEKNVKDVGVKQLNSLTQMYHMAAESMGATVEREGVKMSNDLIQKILTSFPAMAGVNAAAAGGSAGASAGAFAAVGGMMGLRRLWQNVSTQTKLASMIVKATEKMKDVDGTAVAQAIQDAITKKFSQQNTDPEPTTAPGKADVTAGAEPSAPEEMYDVKDTQTGEIKQVAASKLKDFGFDEQGGDDSGLPSMEDIGVAMVADIAAGGKNMTELTALATHLEKMNKVKSETNPERLQASLKQGLKVMEDLYFPATGKSLSLGDKTVGVTGVLKMGGRAVGKITNQELADKIKSYENMRSLAAGLVNQARGAGVLNAGEYEIMMANMPTEYSSEKAAKDWFANIREMLVKNPFIAPQGAVSEGVQ